MFKKFLLNISFYNKNNILIKSNESWNNLFLKIENKISDEISTKILSLCIFICIYTTYYKKIYILEIINNNVHDLNIIINSYIYYLIIFNIAFIYI